MDDNKYSRTRLSLGHDDHRLKTSSIMHDKKGKNQKHLIFFFKALVCGIQMKLTASFLGIFYPQLTVCSNGALGVFFKRLISWSDKIFIKELFFEYIEVIKYGRGDHALSYLNTSQQQAQRRRAKQALRTRAREKKPTS